MKCLEDHELPLVQLKEQRRELIVALMGRTDPISNAQIAEIASLQQAIAAMEAVVGDLDMQAELSPTQGITAPVFSAARGKAAENIRFVFGRRAVAPPEPVWLTQ